MQPKRLAMVVLVLLAAAAMLVSWMRPSREDQVIQAYMRTFDRDGDGRISKSEWASFGGLPDTFAAFDFNADGYLDSAEFKTLFENAGCSPLEPPR